MNHVSLVHYTVAVVDDEPRVLQSIGNLLESAGATVRLYDSAQRLLEDPERSDIHCIISDIGLPGMDGYQLQKWALQNLPDAVVILITARNAPQSAAICANNRGFFQKPFDGQELLSAVSAALHTRS